MGEGNLYTKGSLNFEVPSGNIYIHERLSAVFRPQVYVFEQTKVTTFVAQLFSLDVGNSEFSWPPVYLARQP